MKKMKYILPFVFLMASHSIAFGALGISNLAATNITTTSAYFRASIDGTNTINPTNTLYYGTVDYTTNAGSWAFTNVYGVAGTGNISTQITGLTAANKYYSRWLAQDGTSNIWTSSTTNFWTKPIAPTSTPAVITISLQTDTNGLLKAPTNFWTANKTNIINHVGLATGTPVYAESEPAFTNWLSTNTYIKSSAHTQDWSTITGTPVTIGAGGYGATDVYTKVQSDAAYAPTGAVGSISNDVDELQGRTGTWNAVTGKVDITTFSSHTNNESADIQHLTATEKATATNPPSTNGLASTNWVIGRGYVTNAFGWSGIQATQQIFWVQTVVTTSSVLTNLTVTGTLDPDITVGAFTNIGVFSGYTNWFNSNAVYYSWRSSWDNWYVISTNSDRPGTGATGKNWYNNAGPGGGPTGTFLPTGGATGTATVNYAYVTNLLTTTNTWRAGFDGTNWTVSLNGTNQIDATNVATKVQGLLADTAMQSLAWTNSVISFTNAVVASTQSLDSAVTVLKAGTNGWNNKLATNGSGAGLTGITAAQVGAASTSDFSGVSNRVTALEVPYQEYTWTNTADAGGTSTLTYAMGSLVKIVASNSPTTLTFNNANYPTNGINQVGVSLRAGTNSIAFVTTIISNATAPTISTDNWTSLLFRKFDTNTLWHGRQ